LSLQRRCADRAEILQGPARVSQGKNLPDHFPPHLRRSKKPTKSSCSTKAGIIERGDHEELVRQGGVYAELYQQQRLSEELEQI
jgi:hypothetical protein